MEHYPKNEIWAGGHQPVVDFHTGLQAKVYVIAAEKKGRFIFQDLDTLEEKGAISFMIPTKNGSKKTLKVIDVTKKQRKMLFSAGPVRVAQYQFFLMPLIMSLADRNVDKESLKAVSYRVEELISVIKPGEEFRSTAELVVNICNFIFPRIGLPAVKFELLSEILWTEWYDALSESVELYDFNNFWIRKNGTRVRPQNKREVEQALVQKKLLPKAVPLAFCVRLNNYSLVNGLGQEKYEKSDRHVARLLKKTKSEVATSRQGLPPEWEKLTKLDNFRPSALLLWLLGGYFDSSQIIRYAY